MKLARSLLATLAFLAAFAGVYALHARYFPVQVVLYSAMLDAALAAALCGLLLLLPAFRGFTAFERWQLLVIWCLVGYALAISGPTVIDRSLSFYILEKLQQRGGGIRESRMAQVFRDEYLREHHLVEVRLTEQLESGTIELRNGCVLLTERGRRLASFSRWFRTRLLPRHRLLGERYTDVLTDPFREGAAAALTGYECDGSPPQSDSRASASDKRR
jgi:hypothetical protein